MNMQSVGLNFKPWIDKGLLKFYADRPTLTGLEMHLAKMHKHIEAFNPDVVVVDPINNLITTASETEVRLMLTRLIDYLKMKKISALFTSLIASNFTEENMGVSSLMDTWIILKDLEENHKRQRTLKIVKSRGMAHSNEVSSFTITGEGIQLYGPKS